VIEDRILAVQLAVVTQKEYIVVDMRPAAHGVAHDAAQMEIGAARQSSGGQQQQARKRNPFHRHPLDFDTGLLPVSSS